jgi:hypothetical protein
MRPKGGRVWQLIVGRRFGVSVRLLIVTLALAVCARAQGSKRNAATGLTDQAAQHPGRFLMNLHPLRQ